VWHAIEEIEHRAVAFDVYQGVYGDDKIRRLIMRSVTTGFASLTFYSASRLFLQDRKKSILKLGGNLFGLYLLAKMFVQLLPEYLSYYKTNFHPSDIDYTQLLKYWKIRLADDYQLEGFQQELQAAI
jgi:predicted metal-dependent hydrolase